jgi:hypothetical protein
MYEFTNTCMIHFALDFLVVRRAILSVQGMEPQPKMLQGSCGLADGRYNPGCFE